MDADSLIRDFYSALSRDLLIYMIVVAIATVVAWCGWFNKSTKHRRAWLAAAIALTLLGGGLIGAPIVCIPGMGDLRQEYDRISKIFLNLRARFS